jgi:hypothetical protein
MPAMNEEMMVTISVSTAKFMIERAIEHQNKAMMDGLHRSADFWDGYVKGIRNLINVGEVKDEP